MTEEYMEDSLFIDYNVGPVFLMNLTGLKLSSKEIKDIEDIKKLKSYVSFYVFDEIITKKMLSDFLRPIIIILKNNNIWFSTRPTGFTDSVGDYVASLYSKNAGFNSYMYMTIQSRDYALRTKKLNIYHNIDNSKIEIVSNILQESFVNFDWDQSDNNNISINL